MSAELKSFGTKPKYLASTGFYLLLVQYLSSYLRSFIAFLIDFVVVWIIIVLQNELHFYSLLLYMYSMIVLL